MRLADLYGGSLEALLTQYPLQEARNLLGRLLQERLSLQSFTHITEPSREIPGEACDVFKEDVRRIAAGEPLQYVLGYEEFCGRRFRVSPSVLIPRPETEEMVSAIISRAVSPRTILDLCTGSGCIAWSLAEAFPEAEVTAVDISQEALEIASSQGICPGRPNFVRGDILKEGFLEGNGKFDVIVSNPPYVMDSQKKDMRANVLDHEPGLALFVPDSDPLVFYRAIACFALKRLNPGGFGAVEINDALGAETKAVFTDAGFGCVELRRDVSGRDRFVYFY